MKRMITQEGPFHITRIFDQRVNDPMLFDREGQRILVFMRNGRLVDAIRIQPEVIAYVVGFVPIGYTVQVFDLSTSFGRSMREFVPLARKAAEKVREAWNACKQMDMQMATRKQPNMRPVTLDDARKLALSHFQTSKVLG